MAPKAVSRVTVSFFVNPDREDHASLSQPLAGVWRVISRPFLEITMNAVTQSPNFFNLHTTGVGYVNRIRLVPPSRGAGRRGESFYACSISALRGPSEEAANTYFDLRVSGKEAIEIVQKLEFDQKANRKIFVSFKVGDIYPHLYERDCRDKSGKATGEKEWASLIKGRLLQINSITIDGVKVYQRNSEAPSDVDEDSESDHESEASKTLESDDNTGSSPAATTAVENSSPVSDLVKDEVVSVNEDESEGDGSMASLYTDFYATQQ
jgi:hypothetical protein